MIQSGEGEGLPRLNMRGICKAFPGVQALSGVDFELLPGEIHAIIGQNGAGKSTLVKIASGAYTPDEGQILLDGREVQFRSPADARQAGIMTVYQDWNLFPDLSVAENLLAGRLPLNPRSRTVDWARCYQEASAGAPQPESGHRSAHANRPAQTGAVADARDHTLRLRPGLHHDP